MHGLKVGCAWLVLNPFDLRISWWRYNIKRIREERNRQRGTKRIRKARRIIEVATTI